MKRSINEILDSDRLLLGEMEDRRAHAALREAREVLKQIATSEYGDSHPNDSQDCDVLLAKWDSHD